MTNVDPAGDQTAALPPRNPAGPRESRTIRFSDSEWKQVQTAAKKRAMTSAEFVRCAALSVSGTDPAPDPVQLTPEIATLIQSTYRYAFIVATLKRNELVRDGRGQEVDEAINLARNAQSKILSGTN